MSNTSDNEIAENLQNTATSLKASNEVKSLQSEITKYKNEIESLKNKKKLTIFNPSIWISLLFLMFLGLFLILFSIVIEIGGPISIDIGKQGFDKHTVILFVKEIGILLFAVVSTTLIHELLLRRTLLKETQEVLAQEFTDVIEKSLPDKINEMIKNQLPEKYLHIQESGIVDSYDTLKEDDLIKKIENLEEGSEVFILKIWVKSLNSLDSAIRKAIEKGCVFKIIILSPDQREALTKRARFVETADYEYMKGKIEENIKKFSLIKKSLKTNTEKNKLTVKLHKDFISVSIFGYDSDMLVGFYLHSQISEQNIQLKIHGKHTVYYKKFKEHFNVQWDSPNSETLEDYLIKKAKHQPKTPEN